MAYYIFIVTCIVVLIILLSAGILRASASNFRVATLALILAALLLLLFLYIKNTTRYTEERFNIVSTNAIIGSLVEELAGDDLKTCSIVPLGVEPHEYDVSSKEAKTIEEADILVCNGLNLENSKSFSNAIIRKSHVINLGNYCLKRAPDKILRVHDVFDPHIWMDLKLVVLCVECVTNALSERYPHLANRLLRVSAKMIARIRAVDASVLKGMSSIDWRYNKLVTTHRGFSYFVQAYINKDVKSYTDAPEGISQFIEPVERDIIRVIEFIRCNDVHTIFRELAMPERFVRKIRDKLNAEGYAIKLSEGVLYSDYSKEESLTNPYGCSVPESMARHNVNVILYNLK